MKKEILKKKSGITLIALVITIIVLLILAGISIASLTGENKILTRADNARKITQRNDIIEDAKLKILEYETENKGKITDEKAYEIIAKYDKDYKENETFEFKTNKEKEKYITTPNGYDILVREIWIVEEVINFTIDGKVLTAKKNETWRDWLNRMKNEPKEVVGTFVYFGWHEAKVQFFELGTNYVECRDYGGGGEIICLYSQRFQERVQYVMVIEERRRVLCTGNLRAVMFTQNRDKQNNAICSEMVSNIK